MRSRGETMVPQRWPTRIPRNWFAPRIPGCRWAYRWWRHRRGKLASKKNIEIKVSVDSLVREVFLDPGKLKQVLYNYLSNALKFTPERGKVHVVATAVGNGEFRIGLVKAVVVRRHRRRSRVRGGGGGRHRRLPRWLRRRRLSLVVRDHWHRDGGPR